MYFVVICVHASVNVSLKFKPDHINNSQFKCKVYCINTIWGSCNDVTLAGSPIKVSTAQIGKFTI